jgi:hypothetical protein
MVENWLPSQRTVTNHNVAKFTKRQPFSTQEQIRRHGNIVKLKANVHKNITKSWDIHIETLDKIA